ncbi:voltage-dependent calcium channel subunit alpha-2/delta-3 isoform X2 [Phlebotomus argentipes]|uniref:voltage-dependent calcium channel subunit alpha-2/delta-3 isoform X2 n=1 Tax=Phlebotomus argentipes TaxID=94469 RepID=UPI002893292A|nr:voltage-dependent calcium channel subunit alpha-2/delta-3 isoform X2 [Phlebotomus argentipes]
MNAFGVLLCCLILIPSTVIPSRDPRADENIKYGLVHAWAEKLGIELWHVGEFITRRKLVQDSFKQAQVVPRSGLKIADEMAKEIHYLMESRISAVKRIMDAAENMALSYEHKEADQDFQYYNAKEMIEPGEAPPTADPRDLDDNGEPKKLIPPKEISLTPEPHFFNVRVNTNYSSVHVPTNVYDRSIEVISAIEWSEKLDSIFRDNYNNDPTLSWQFFGSSTGFMRQFPASKWQEDPVDLYDCRLRSWYIEAANSPKDIVILVDSSGSMTGQRNDIAKHVVNSILDTLGTNDFVNIFNFSLGVDEIVPCFRDMLVQANMENIRQLKMGMEGLRTEEIANVTAALIRAFELLEEYRNDRVGARCNQAIMLISDGVPYKYQDIFEYYNWPYIPVRMFTYLIGREVADVKEIKWMACENRGYYVHLSTMAEVREQVLNYIPVMARPLVLNKTHHPIVWTQVYADEIDPKMTDWQWEIREREEQRERFMSQRKNYSAFHHPDEQDRRYRYKLKKNLDQSTESDKYHFMTTVAMPVFDRRENANITEDILVNEAYWVTITRETKIANLLGVAGTDVPIKDIKRLMMPFMLGVNGYAFIVTNNGYVLIHPDLRPIFQGILKPAYNAVDMIEVELMDDDRDPRDFNENLIEMRDSIINQSNGSKWMLVKYHLDNMRRVSRIKRQYFWTPLKESAFSLVVTYPESYGVNRIQPRTEDEIHRLLAQGHNLTDFFSGTHWSIHPDWIYCKSKHRFYSSPENELKDVLKNMSKPGWRWPTNRTPPPPEHAASFNYSNNSGRSASKSEKDQYYCDRNLMQSLVYDAKVTSWWNATQNLKDDKGNEFKQRFGITVAFMATHSGLMRWQEFYSNSVEEIRSDQSFSDVNKRAVDEIWYKRAVEQHFVESTSFTYSVPFDAAEEIQNTNDTLVTASHAIFHSDGGKSAPVAVVGFQFQHSALLTMFRNITANCGDASCSKTCASDGINCYILDNNGYVIVSPEIAETGKFFGEVKGSIMQRLVDENIYKQVLIYDYQSVCFALKNESANVAGILMNPFKFLLQLLQSFGRLVMFFLVELLILPTEAYNAYSYAADDLYYPESYDGFVLPTEPYGGQLPKAKEPEFDRRVLINKTRPETCDQVITLYQLNMEKEKTVFKKPASGCERPFVVTPISYSNLILLVVDTLCPISDPEIILSTMAMNFDYNGSLACHKIRFNDLQRKRPVSCINTHDKESTIELCGEASRFGVSLGLLSLILVSILH